MTKKEKLYEINRITSESSTIQRIRTNYVKARINQMQQNSLCGDRDETINPIISDCSKLARGEYKTRHD